MKHRRYVKGETFRKGQWVDVEGHFEGWGLDTIEDREGRISSFTVAMVETSDMTIVFVPPEKLHFEST